MEKTKIVYSYKDSERIDTWLTKTFSYSRNFFHHIIERNGVLLNGKPAKKSVKLKSGDEIEIDDLERFLTPAVFLQEAPELDIPIIKEEEDYLIINKPKGVLSHPNSVWEVGSPSVVGFLYHHYKSLPSVGNFIRAGLVHRLDKDTDGLMIIAKTEKGLKHFKSLFQEKSEKQSLAEKDCVPLKKWYYAVSTISPEGEKFLHTIKKSLPYCIQEEVKAKVPYSIPKLGITQIEAIENLKNNTVGINLQIFTGRTHQIRYHLSHHGLPILGDELYGKKTEIPLQLTAYKLVYKDLDNSIQTISLK